jgi:aspartyl-tRNA(Asn)/glutamyl-tRNA(Gln) amidotransferase subunit A
MQIAGRPFDDARVLAAGHAYEQATGWHKKRPSLVPGAAPGAIDPKPWVPDISAVEPAVRARAETAAHAANLRLPDPIMQELIAVAPWALAMARRLKRDHGREVEVSSIYDPGRDID